MKLLELDNLIAGLKQSGKYTPTLTVSEGRQIMKDVAAKAEADAAKKKRRTRK